MKKKEEITFEKLRLLAEGKLNAEESEKLHLLLKEDEENRKIFEGIKDFISNESASVEEFVASSQAKLSEKMPRAKKNHQALFYWSSGIAALLIIGFFIYNNDNNWRAKYDFKDAGLAVTLGVEKNELNPAMNAYKLGEFEKAESILNKLLAQNPKNDTLIYYKAVVLKEMKQYQAAIDFFEKIDAPSEFKKKASFQLALSYWFLGNRAKASTLFESIASSTNHPFNKEATEILKQFSE